MIEREIRDIDSYIALQAEEVQPILMQLRNTIKKAAPKAEEVISYQMPAFKQNGMLAYFAAYKKHIGFYPTATPIKTFQTELVNYKYSKGAIQFPIDKKLPLGLITKMVKFKVAENNAKVKKIKLVK